MTDRFLNVLHQKPFADVFCIESVSEEDKVDPVALCCFVECDDFVFGVGVVILGKVTCCPVVLVFELEDNLSLAVRAVGHLLEFQFELGLAFTLFLT